MNPNKFISTVRDECINDLVSGYEETFSKTDIKECSDSSMKPLIQYWKQADNPTRKVLSDFIRLGAQNGVSSLISIISSGGHFDGEFKEFELSSIDENSKAEFGEDLLDVFWEQEEISGNVNTKT
ncbi:hypothetical protein H4J38_16880 [Colwellia sp. BRX10-3]|uniref:hypothetical protein n=1 Tax=Colwellia sp. BRX10-3 TaxID=2759844 RepID=UPI0015F6E4BF|nr:hypothetical protein [Colwellia sp. BRX10-3]MBA6392440.1 hypothetical protein [Colwellia sp. BRX10-3]